MDLPLVSVCMPIYNPDAFIIEALDCALQQTYQNIEIIVVDDGSTKLDNAVVEKYFKQHAKIKYYRNETNLGLVGNWQKSIDLANGNWIKFHFQDDLMDATCIEKMMQGIMTHNTQAALCSRNFVFEKNADADFVSLFTNRLVKPEMLFASNEIITPEKAAKQLSKFLLTNVLGEPICVLFSKAAYQSVGGFNNAMHQLVDYEFLQKLLLTTDVYFTNEKLVSFRIHDKSTSSSNVVHAAQNDIAKKIRTVEGDSLVMLHHYLYHPIYAPIKQLLGQDLLETLLYKIYWKACRKHGEAIVNKALQPQLALFSSAIKKYNYLKYKFLKFKFKRNVAPYILDYSKAAPQQVFKI